MKSWYSWVFWDCRSNNHLHLVPTYKVSYSSLVHFSHWVQWMGFIELCHFWIAFIQLEHEFFQCYSNKMCTQLSFSWLLPQHDNRQLACCLMTSWTKIFMTSTGMHLCCKNLYIFKNRSIKSHNYMCIMARFETNAVCAGVSLGFMDKGGKAPR